MKKLYIVTGFLGAGKTTFLKQLFGLFKERVAVIVNEYGAVGVDGELIRQSGIEVTEITNGSIFCVCRSDLFIDALNLAAKADAQVIIVETSGLSDPLSSDLMLEQLKRIYGVEFDFEGIIAVIDAKNFHKVLSTTVSVKNQVIAADLFVINKVDLVDEKQLFMVERELSFLNPTAPMIKTTYGKIDRLVLSHTEKSGGSRAKDMTSQKLCFDFSGEVVYNEFVEWLGTFSHLAYRIKGYVRTEKGDFRVEGVMGDVTLLPCEINGDGYLVVLYNSTNKVKEVTTNGRYQSC